METEDQEPDHVHAEQPQYISHKPWPPSSPILLQPATSSVYSQSPTYPTYSSYQTTNTFQPGFGAVFGYKNIGESHLVSDWVPEIWVSGFVRPVEKLV